MSVYLNMKFMKSSEDLTKQDQHFDCMDQCFKERDMREDQRIKDQKSVEMKEVFGEFVDQKPCLDS